MNKIKIALILLKELTYCINVINTNTKSSQDIYEKYIERVEEIKENFLERSKNLLDAKKRYECIELDNIVLKKTPGSGDMKSALEKITQGIKDTKFHIDIHYIDLKKWIVQMDNMAKSNKEIDVQTEKKKADFMLEVCNSALDEANNLLSHIPNITRIIDRFIYTQIEERISYTDPPSILYLSKIGYTVPAYLVLAISKLRNAKPENYTIILEYIKQYKNIQYVMGGKIDTILNGLCTRLYHNSRKKKDPAKNNKEAELNDIFVSVNNDLKDCLENMLSRLVQKKSIHKYIKVFIELYKMGKIKSLKKEEIKNQVIKDLYTYNNLSFFRLILVHFMLSDRNTTDQIRIVENNLKLIIRSRNMPISRVLIDLLSKPGYTNQKRNKLSTILEAIKENAPFLYTSYLHMLQTKCRPDKPNIKDSLTVPSKIDIDKNDINNICGSKYHVTLFYILCGTSSVSH